METQIVFYVSFIETNGQSYIYMGFILDLKADSKEKRPDSSTVLIKTLTAGVHKVADRKFPSFTIG